jgi:glycosyltransferase involved in cell wall biosynthesis
VSGRRLLVVSWPYPPAPSVGGNRWLALSRYLRERGHDVTILTTAMFGSLPDDAAEQVVRAHDLAGSDVVRRGLRRAPLSAGDGAAPPAAKPSGLLTKVVVPDAWLLSWAPFAVRAARSIVAERRIDCLVTTTPYESTHLVAFGLGRGRPAWVADFRDGWSFESHRPPFPTAAQRALDSRLERAVATRADRVVGATMPIVEDFRERLGVDAAHVANGWDPDVAPAEGGHAAPELTPGRVTLLHTGTLSGGWGRDPRPLFDALELLASRRPRVAERLEVLLVGRTTPDLERLLAGAGLGRLVRTSGHVTRAASLELQRRADALLLVTAARNRGEATGKLFEYLGAGRPILALADGNEAARIVRETQTGVTVPPDDPAAIADALEVLVERGLPHAGDSSLLAPYVYPAPALAMEAEIERAIAQRGRRASA